MIVSVRKVFPVLPFLFFVVIGEGIIFLLLSIGSFQNNTIVSRPKDNSSSYVWQIVTTTDIKKQKQLLSVLLDTIGPLDTQDQLVQAGLRHTGQSHLLIHDVGKYVYKKFGNKALLYCRPYFIYSCYHGVIISEIGKNGIAGLDILLGQCKGKSSDKKSSTDEYYQCSHAVGHGLLAWNDYDLGKTLPQCDTIAQTDTTIAEPCYEGAFMENIFGIHRGAPIPDNNNPWVSKTDYYYPCNTVNQAYRSACWSHQASRMFVMVKGDLQKVATLCTGVVSQKYRTNCYHNLFLRIHTQSAGNTDQIISRCKIIGQNLYDSCMHYNALIANAMGESKENNSRLCVAIGKKEEKQTCLEELDSSHQLQIPAVKQKNTLCLQQTEDIYSQGCSWQEK